MYIHTNVHIVFQLFNIHLELRLFFFLIKMIINHFLSAIPYILTTDYLHLLYNFKKSSGKIIQGRNKSTTEEIFQ